MWYTQAQVRDLLSLPLQTYRYWAATIPHLASRSGKKAALTAGDVLALALTKEACVGLGVSVGTIHVGLNAMFSLLDGASWPSVEGCVLVLSPDRAEFVPFQKLAGRGRFPGAALVIPCGPLMGDLRARMLPEAALRDSGQARLPLIGRVASGRDIAAGESTAFSNIGKRA